VEAVGLRAVAQAVLRALKDYSSICDALTAPTHGMMDVLTGRLGSLLCRRVRYSTRRRSRWSGFV